MSLSPFLDAVPSSLRFVLALTITVGLTLLAVRLLHRRMQVLFNDDARAGVALFNWDGASPDAPLPPSTDLGAKVTGLTQTAFVFLLAFTLANFWGHAQDARTAVMNEAQAYQRAQILAQSIAPPSASTAVVAGLAAYQTSVQGPELQAMRAGDSQRALSEHARASTRLATALQEAGDEGATSSPVWSDLMTATEDLVQAGTTRVAQVPGPTAPTTVALILLLGLANLVLVIALLPTRRRPNYVLAGILAAVTGAMFYILVEASNPYVGASAVHLPFPLG